MSELPSQENRLIQVSVLFKGEDPARKKKFSNEKLLLESFTGQEGISMPFHFDLVLRSVDPAVDFDKVVGQPATIRVLLPDNKFRFIDGIVSTFTQLEKTHDLTTYQATLVPKLWILTRNYDCRIFQNRTVPQIIKVILKENGVIFVDDQLSTQGKDPDKPLYPPREYCVQYNETDFDFISRLMEEEGIFYFFRHEETKHTLVLADNPLKFVANPLLPQKGGEPEAIYGKIAETGAFDAAITAWNVAQEVRPDIYELRDFNFKQPTLDLTFSAQTGDDKTLEIYEFPGEYDDKSRGQHLIDVKIEQIETTQKVISGGSRYAGLLPGFYFVLKDHFRSDFNNTKYVPTSIFHVAQQGGNYQATSKDAQCDYSYTNTFTCIPHPTKFRPPQTTQLPVISSTQTAIVVGHKEKPANEEIYMDELGRVKVRFHWDRRKQNQPNPDDDDPIEKCPGDCSCFIRVAQPWAGKAWGHQWIPRIGQEVVVTFLDGDPDRPLITGMVYNGDNPPPFKNHPTQSGIKTHSTSGGTEQNYNLIRFEDKKGHEQLWIHAERSMLESVEASQTITVGGSRSITTGGEKDGVTHGDVKELVYKNHNLHVKGDDRTNIDGKVSETVKGDEVHSITGGYYLTSSKSAYINAPEIFIQGGTKLTLMVGGSFVVLDAGGVTVVGPMVKLNPAGAAPPVPPVVPAADPADDP
jgi:type VI secretion system secreted protein VgrG